MENEKLEFLEKVKKLHSGPNRHYHVWSHPEYMIDIAKEYNINIDSESPLLYAIMFHDIVYDPTRKDNEEESTKLARTMIREKLKFLFPSEKIENFLYNVETLIKVTKTHNVDDLEGVTSQDLISDCEIMCDLDLAILGDTWENYFFYTIKIREEYKHLSVIDWVLGRREWLNKMLKNLSIYHTQVFSIYREDRAVANMMRELEFLKDFFDKEENKVDENDIGKISWTIDFVATNPGTLQMNIVDSSYPTPIGIMFFRETYDLSIEVLDTFVTKSYRRKGIRTMMNNILFQNYSNIKKIVTKSGTKSGKAFMKARGYIFDEDNSHWYLLR